MKAADSRTCPACGTHNKVKWEFCARCGESLEGVVAGAPAAPATAAADAGSGTEFPFRSLIGGVLAVAAIWYAVTYRPVVEKPAPETFTVPTLPPSPFPPVDPPQKGPGRDTFTEGVRLLRAGDPAGAVRLLAESVSAEPDNAVFRNVYGRALLATGAQVQAIEQLRQASTLASGEPAFRIDLAKALEAVGRTKEAIGEYETVLTSTPDNVDGLRGLAEIHNRGGSAEGSRKALPYLERVVALQPGDLVLQQQLAYALDKSGEAAKAIEAYQRVLRDMPQAAVTRGLLGDLLFRQGKKDEAVALVQQGIAADPKSPLLHRTLGSLLEQSGKIDEAIAEYRRYAVLAPNADDSKQLTERAAKLEELLKASQQAS